MAYSARYKTLESRISELRKQFLPKTFSSSGSYSSKELDNARAFRVLVHAELEHYFEERALEIAKVAVQLWISKSKPTVPLACLLTNIVGEQQGLPKKLGTQITALTVAGKVLSQYKHNLANNHGIRIPNLLEILLPVGVKEADIDSFWLSTTDGFAAKRGATAHSAAVTYQIDPQDDFKTVSLIMQGVRDIDTQLNTIRRTIR